MFGKNVTISFYVDSLEYIITINISCIPDTPDSELIERAKKRLYNIIKNDAEFHVY